MESFSWTDGIRATVSACLPCFSSPRSGNDSEAEDQMQPGRRGSQTRFEELEGLLRDVDDTDGEAETMSLHSRLEDGRQQRRRKKRYYRTIRLFGYHLFGRPPIQLTDSEDETDNNPHRRRPGCLALGSAYSSSSAEAFDSDASPLDPAVISQLSPQDAAARAAQAAQEREAEELRRRQEEAEKAERCRRRKERRQLKRAAAALANGAALSLDGEDFEGFPGSGSLRPPSSLGSLSSAAFPTVADTFGRRGGIDLPDEDDPADADADADADFGGEAYVRKSTSRGSDSSRSHTHPQTSASRSNSDPPQHQSHQTQASPLSPPYNAGLSSGKATTVAANRGTVRPGSILNTSRKKGSQRSSSSATSSSKRSPSSPTSQSASLPSLESPVRASNSPQRLAPAEPFIVSHDESPGQVLTNSSNEPSTPKFPMTGFGGVTRTKNSSSGVFLARRGND